MGRGRPRNEGLSDQERKVLWWSSKGYTSQEIAELMCLSVHTVEAHRKNYLSKLYARNQAHAVSIAHQSGLFE